VENNILRAIGYGNYQLIVSLDKGYIIRNIYYPHVGMDNLGGRKIGKIL